MKQMKIKKWVDGDSGYFTNNEAFRLANVRCPESYQFGGTTALRTVAGMTSRYNNVVMVTLITYDNYRRAVVEMKNPDGSINERMRAKGYTNKGR
mgnify:CR=1 FL=1